MATTIQVKRSTSVTDAEMASNTLAYGELAYSFHATTNKLWIGNNSNAPTTIGGSYFTELFNSNTTAGTNTTGKILISNSTDGSLDFSDKNLTNVSAFDATSIVVGDPTKTATITNTGDVLGIVANTGIDLTLSTPTAMTLNAASIQGSVIKDEDAMGSDSAIHLATQQSIKKYVDDSSTNQTQINQLNSSVEVIDAGTGSIVNTVDANATMTVLAASATMQAADFRLKLKSPDTANTQDAKDTAIQFLDSGDNILGQMSGVHDGATAATKGAIVFSTHNGSASSEALRIDSSQNVTVVGDLTVQGTRNIVNTTITTLDDPVLTLGGDFGGVTAVTFTDPGNWGGSQTAVVVEQYSSNGGGQGATFAITTNAGNAITAVTIVNAGIDYVGTNTIVVQDPTSTGSNMTITVTTVNAGPATDDNRDRGIEFSWHDGSNPKMGFFGFDDSSGKFTFIPEATKGSAEVFSGTAGVVAATTFEGALTGNVTGDLNGTVNTATQNSITTMTGLTQTGALSIGSINAGVSNNFPITMGTSNFTTSGQLVVNVDGTAESADGAITLGAGADAALWVASDDLNIYNQGQDTTFDAASWNFLNAATGATAADVYLGKTTSHALKVSTAINGSDHLTSVTFDTPAGAGVDADRGQYVWKVDGRNMFTITDDGITGHTATGGDATYSSPEGTSGQTTPYIDNFIISGGLIS
jgi:hypothetical protein